MKKMKTILGLVLMSSTVFAGAPCELEAKKVAGIILENNAKIQNVEFSLGEAGLILGEKGSFAFGIIAKVGKSSKEVRVDFTDANSCLVKNISIENGPSWLD